MKLSKFNFTLPQELIASYPAGYTCKYNDDDSVSFEHKENFEGHRDECRLLVLHAKSNRIEHRMFKDILDYYGDKDLFIFNDTQVFPAQLSGNKEKTQAMIKVLLLRELHSGLRLWDVIVDPARKIRVGNKLYFGEDNSMVAEVIDNTTSRGRTVRFLYDGPHEEFLRDLYALGKTPLPAHIDRDAEPDDVDRYQTIFAKNEGAVVVPAAGTHFSRELMKRMEIKGIDTSFLTLHISMGIFRHIDVEDLSKHKPDSEQMFVGDDVVKKFNDANAEGRNICAVGTSVLRALETASIANGMIKPYEGWNNKFIFPTYKFTTANSLVSNFQLPLSSMLMNQAAFGGYDAVMGAYKEAIKEKYMFGFYGDAMLILND